MVSILQSESWVWHAASGFIAYINIIDNRFLNFRDFKNIKCLLIDSKRKKRRQAALFLHQ
jgi:hypothetical protein